MRAAAFVDGLNLYHGMVDADLDRYKWLNIGAMCQQLLYDAQNRLNVTFNLEAVTYCTSYVQEKQSQSRQDVYLQALKSHEPALTIILGKYEAKGRDCDCDCGCHNRVEFQKEKRTDVNLAVAMLRAAMGPDSPEALLLVTGDTDLVPAIEAAQEHGKQVIVAAPPARHQEHLNAVADAYLRVGRRQLKYSPLPGVVESSVNGYPLTPPPSWTHPDEW